MDVVVGDPISLAAALCVAPPPADGDPGVEKVVDVVVAHYVVGAEPDPDADGAGEDPAATADDAVVDRGAGGFVGWPGGRTRVPDPHAAGAEVLDQAPLDAAAATAAAEPDPVGADAGDRAVAEGHVVRPVELHCRLDRGGGLGRL